MMLADDRQMTCPIDFPSHPDWCFVVVIESRPSDSGKLMTREPDGLLEGGMLNSNCGFRARLPEMGLERPGPHTQSGLHLIRRPLLSQNISFTTHYCILLLARSSEQSIAVYCVSHIELSGCMISEGFCLRFVLEWLKKPQSELDQSLSGPVTAAENVALR